jgi:hypothetical protein
MMKTLVRCFAVILFAAIGSGSAQAITIFVSSTFSTTPAFVGTTIFIEGLGDHEPPSLGAFDLTLQFDPAVISVDQVVFTSLFGSPDERRFSNSGGTLIPVELGGGDALADASLSSPGSLNLTEVSLLEASAGTCIFCIGPFLEDLQPSRFVLAGISFDGLVEIPNAVRGRGRRPITLPR